MARDALERLAFTEGWNAAQDTVLAVARELAEAGRPELSSQVFDLVWERLTGDQRLAATARWAGDHMHDQLHIG
jgi:hypothetical protein